MTLSPKIILNPYNIIFIRWIVCIGVPPYFSNHTPAFGQTNQAVALTLLELNDFINRQFLQRAFDVGLTGHHTGNTVN